MKVLKMTCLLGLGELMSATLRLQEQRDGGLFGLREARSKREKCRAIARLSFGVGRQGITMADLIFMGISIYSGGPRSAGRRERSSAAHGMASTEHRRLF